MNDWFRCITLIVCLPALTAANLHPPQLEPRERVVFHTESWEGERDLYGRPIVPDELLERMKHVDIEEAMTVLHNEGYHHQLERGWEMVRAGDVMVGRALTADFVPRRPDLEQRFLAIGRERNLADGGSRPWPIEMLVEQDVIVADSYGSSSGSSLFEDYRAQAIASRSAAGAVVYGQARDLIDIRKMGNLKAWVKHWNPDPGRSGRESMLIGINGVVRIGEAVVLPGDVVLANDTGVVFIPAHLAEKVVVGSEVIRLVHAFRVETMERKIYTSNQVNTGLWDESITAAFYGWLESERERITSEYGVQPNVMERMIRTRDRFWKEWFEGHRLVPLD